MATVVTESFSDEDLFDPAEYENGYKEKRIVSVSTCERALSSQRTGAWKGATTTIKYLDYDQKFRQQQASATDRYVVEPNEIKMATDDVRNALGDWWTVFVGLVTQAKAIDGPDALQWEEQLADLIGQKLLNDEMRVPWRRIQDSFLDEVTNLAFNFDHEQPEPILYGEMNRPLGGYAPIYLGNDGSDHIWMVAGHAMKAVSGYFVNGVASGSFTLVNPIDKTSFTYGNTRTYCLITGPVGDTDADAAADAGTDQRGLVVNFQGIEDVGDGSGTLITDRIQQYKHFVVNFIANYGENSWQSGAWLTSPDWTLQSETVPMVDETSFDDCSAIAVLRTPALGYLGVAVIGATSSDRKPARDWITDWNLSCDVRFGVTRRGQFKVCMLHPTQAIKDAAPIYTDAYEILRGGFGTDLQYDELANVLPFNSGYNWAQQRYEWIGIAQEFVAIANYDRRIAGAQLKYLFVPDFDGGQHLSDVEVVRRANVPRTIAMEQVLPATTPLTDPVPVDLATLELGDYLQYQHFAQVGTSPDQVRLAQIERIIFSPTQRKVRIEAIDCEELIDYDMFDAGSP